MSEKKTEINRQWSQWNC